MKTTLQQIPICASQIRYIKGLGKINLNKAEIEEGILYLCIPIQIENDIIKGYISQAHKQFMSDYPKAKNPHLCETLLILNFDYPQTKYDILVSFADDDTQEYEIYDIISKYGIDINTNMKSFLDKILLEQLSKMIFNK